jgi:hypothetical protein
MTASAINAWPRGASSKVRDGASAMLVASFMATSSRISDYPFMDLRGFHGFVRHSRALTATCRA